MVSFLLQFRHGEVTFSCDKNHKLAHLQWSHFNFVRILPQQSGATDYIHTT